MHACLKHDTVDVHGILILVNMFVLNFNQENEDNENRLENSLLSEDNEDRHENSLRLHFCLSVVDPHQRYH